jgi:deazaflavin-dependent oxidoreductase (nitroreductase family)
VKPEHKRALTRVVERYVLNPQMRFALHRNLAPANFALLETTGRRSGKVRRTPVGGVLDGDVFWLVAEHGRRSDYVKNLVADYRVRVKTGGRWRAGRATVLARDDGRRRRRELDQEHGCSGRFDGMIFRLAATDPLTIRIDLDGAAR